MRALIFFFQCCKSAHKTRLMVSKILNQRKEAELFTPVPFECGWGAVAGALKKTRHANEVEENQVGNPEKGWRQLSETTCLGR